MKKIFLSCIACLMITFTIFGFAGCGTEEDPDANKCTITVNVNNEDYGTVTGGGTYTKQSFARLVATPKSGYFFSHWSDNSVSEINDVKVDQDVVITAYFYPGEGDSLKVNGHVVTVIDGSITYKPTLERYEVISNNQYTFGYWWTTNENTVAETTNKFYFKTSEITKNIIYKAEYTRYGFAFGYSENIYYSPSGTLASYGLYDDELLDDAFFQYNGIFDSGLIIGEEFEKHTSSVENGKVKHQYSTSITRNQGVNSFAMHMYKLFKTKNGKVYISNLSKTVYSIACNLVYDYEYQNTLYEIEVSIN